MKKLFGNKYFRYALGIAVGAAGGFSYYYFVGCRGGSCPLTSNAYFMSAYGAVFGVLIVPWAPKSEAVESVESSGE